MSNHLKGEVTFEAKGESWKLAYPINSIIALEDALGVKVDALDQSIRTVRTVFWAGLLAHNEVSEHEAGELIDAIGLPKAAELTGAAFTQAFPGEIGRASCRERV